jgi:hypothetical protein
MISTVELQRTYEAGHRANLARIRQLAQDAQTKADEADVERNRLYWLGFKDGLLRTINVLEGHG